MKHTLVFALLLFVFGCGEGTSSHSADTNSRGSATHSPTSTNMEVVSPPTQTDKSAAHSLSRVNQAQASTTSKLAIAPLLPRPIQSDRDAQECLAAASELDRQINEFTGQEFTSVTRRLKDCVVQYDEAHRGYTKFYPGRVYVRLYLRNSDTADLNVVLGPEHTTVIHIRIDDTSMLASCQDVAGIQMVDVFLVRLSDTEPFGRNLSWDKLDDPDALEKFCMQAYNDFQQLRGH